MWQNGRGLISLYNIDVLGNENNNYIKPASMKAGVGIVFFDCSSSPEKRDNVSHQIKTIHG